MALNNYGNFDDKDNSGFLWDAHAIIIGAKHKETLLTIRAWDAMRDYKLALGEPVCNRRKRGIVGWDSFLTDREGIISGYVRMDYGIYESHIEPLFQFAVSLGCVIRSQPRVFGGNDYITRSKAGFKWYACNKNFPALASDVV